LTTASGDFSRLPERGVFPQPLQEAFFSFEPLRRAASESFDVSGSAQVAIVFSSAVAGVITSSPGHIGRRNVLNRRPRLSSAFKDLQVQMWRLWARLQKFWVCSVVGLSDFPGGANRSLAHRGSQGRPPRLLYEAGAAPPGDRWWG
jgi:hypothetical protein